MKHTLPKQALAAIEEAGRLGREAWKRGNLDAAEKHFLDAWNALPEPKFDQDYAQSLSWGLATFFRDTHQYEKARQWIPTVREAYGPEPDPSVAFLAGTVAFDSGDLNEAFRLFYPLYVQYKARPFEDCDPKYLDFTRKRAQKGQ
jgi:hypothetical protein